MGSKQIAQIITPFGARERTIFEWARDILSNKLVMGTNIAHKREWDAAAQCALDGDTTDLNYLLNCDAMFDFYLEACTPDDPDYTFEEWLHDNGGYRTAMARYLPEYL